MSVVSKGYKKAQKKLQDMKRAELFKDIQELRIKDGETVRLRFIDAEPFEIRVHQLQRYSKNGKPYYVSLTCALDEEDASAFCYLCQEDRARYNGVYRVLVRREYKIIKDSNGKFVEEQVKDVKDGGTVMLLRAGVTLANLLFNRKEKVGDKFTNADCEIERVGSGIGTSYVIDFMTAKKESAKDKKLVKEMTEEKVVEYLQPLSPLKIFEMFPHLAAGNTTTDNSAEYEEVGEEPSDDIPF